MRIIQLNLHLSLAFMFPPPTIVALSTKLTDTSPNRVPSAFSSHRRRRVRLHIPAALAWVSGGPCRAAGRQEKANQILNIYIGTHRIVSGGAEPDCGVVLLFFFPPRGQEELEGLHHLVAARFLRHPSAPNIADNHLS